MKILYNGAEPLTNKQEKEKVKRQRKICPCCEKKRNFFIKFLEDMCYYRYVGDRLYSVYYVCVCNRCKTVWKTDCYKVVN